MTEPNELTEDEINQAVRRTILAGLGYVMGPPVTTLNGRTVDNFVTPKVTLTGDNPLLRLPRD